MEVLQVLREAAVAVKVLLLVQVKRAKRRQLHHAACKLFLRDAQIGRQAVKLRQVEVLQVHERAAAQAVVALLLAVAGQHGRKLGRRQVAGIHRQVDKVARQRHAQAQPRLLVFDKPVERRRGEHVAQRAELGKPREHQAGHGVFLGQRDGCAFGTEESLDKRGRLRLNALVAQRCRSRGFIAFGRLRHLPAQREAVLAVHGLGTDVHVLRRFVEVELQLAGNGAIGVYLVRRADLQL